MFAMTNFLFFAALLLLSLHATEAKVGVCYGMKGDNLPCAQEVVDLYQFYGISAMRLYGPDQATLKALQGTDDIKVMLGVPNENITSIASKQSTAQEWVDTNVVPYAKSIKYIIVGNEIHPSDEEASSMEPAMQNLQNALDSCHLGTEIKVSTAIDTSLIQSSFPPSSAEFQNLTYIKPIIKFITTYDSPLFANIQPYIAYVNDPKNIRLDYALFKACGTVFTDNKTGMSYQNLFDALYDATYVATQKVADNFGSFKNKRATVGDSESGWPSKRGFHRRVKSNSRRMTRQHHYTKARGRCGWPSEGSEPATARNAKTFYTNLIKHVKQGSPLTQGQEIETYLFAMFDENLKSGDESERHYGLFTPDEEPKYGILDFSGEFEY